MAPMWMACAFWHLLLRHQPQQVTPQMSVLVPAPAPVQAPRLLHPLLPRLYSSLCLSHAASWSWMARLVMTGHMKFHIQSSCIIAIPLLAKRRSKKDRRIFCAIPTHCVASFAQAPRTKEKNRDGSSSDGVMNVALMTKKQKNKKIFFFFDLLCYYHVFPHFCNMWVF